MINKIITALILFMILATSVVPVGVRAQAPSNPTACANAGGSWVGPEATGRCFLGETPGAGAAGAAAGAVVGAVANAVNNSWPVEAVAQWIGGFLQRISGLFLLISGLLFDGVINYTVKDMSENLGTEEGIGGSIQSAWSTLRDISNMVFIFVLLYTAFSYMFNVGSGNIGSNIAWIIVIALVINFSLFFSRVIIDASNVISLGFYRAIENAGGYTLNLQNDPNATATANNTAVGFSGISGGYMRMLGIHSFWSPTANINVGGATNILLIGILSAIFVLVVSVVLLIASIMFVSRFVILIFIMILSPVALVMFIIPGMKGKFDEWWKALINQSFFAPVFFGLTWVVFKLGTNANFLNGVKESNVNWADIVTSPKSAMGLIINYFIVIGLSIFALSVSKGMAKSVSQFASVSTAIGTAAIGTAAWAGRNTIGRKALSMSNNKELRDAAAAGNMTARMKLWAAGKTAERSFDVRAIGGTGVGKALGLDKSMDSLGKAGGKDGFAKSVENKAKAKADYAKKYYGQTDEEKDEFERRKEEEKEGILRDRVRKEREAREARKKAEENRSKYMDDQTKEHSEKIKDLNNKKKSVEREMKNTTDEEKKKEYRMELNSINTEIMNEREAKKELEKKTERDDQDYQKLKEDADEAKKVAEKAKSQLGKKDIDDDELSKELQAYKNAYKDRLENFATRVERESPVSTTIGAVAGGIVGSVPGSIIGGVIGNKIGGKTKFNWVGNKSAARSIRKLKSEKSAKDKAFEAVKQMQDEENKTTSGGEPPQQPPATPQAGGTTQPLTP